MKKAIERSEETYNVDRSGRGRLFLGTASEAGIHASHSSPPAVCVCDVLVLEVVFNHVPVHRQFQPLRLTGVNHLLPHLFCLSLLSYMFHQKKKKKKPPSGIPNKGIKCVQLLSLCTTFACGSFSGCSSAGIQYTHV